MKYFEQLFTAAWLIIVSTCLAFLMAQHFACGPVSVQVKQEVWQCEAKHEGTNGTVNFEGCKRDGTSQDTLDAEQPDSGPEIDLKIDPDKVSALLN